MINTKSAKPSIFKSSALLPRASATNASILIITLLPDGHL